MSGPSGHGCEVAFRLGPGRDEQARSLADDLMACADGCRRGVLFLNDAGEYGLLIEWERRVDAEGFAARPSTRAALARLGEVLGREPSVRVYRMEGFAPPPA